jgi:potassium-transporting ATPase KdpC subunit
LDPDISPASAEFQIPRVAPDTHMNPDELRIVVRQDTLGRQWGFLGEPRVNVSELNSDPEGSHPFDRIYGLRGGVGFLRDAGPKG